MTIILFFFLISYGSGRPKSVVVPENITQVHKIVLGDRELKMREISDTLKISEGSVYNFAQIFGDA